MIVIVLFEIEIEFFSKHQRFLIELLLCVIITCYINYITNPRTVTLKSLMLIYIFCFFALTQVDFIVQRHTS
jgi:hypothetical protein